MRGVEDVQAYVKQGVLVVDKVGVRRTVSVIAESALYGLQFHDFDEDSHGFFSHYDFYGTVVCVEEGVVWEDRPQVKRLRNSWGMAQRLARELDR